MYYEEMGKRIGRMCGGGSIIHRGGMHGVCG